MSTLRTSSAAPLTRRSLLAAAVATLAWRPGRAAIAQPDAAQALHVLNRLAFGPAPGDLDRVMRLGADAWIAEQMRPAALPLPDPLARQLAALESPIASPRELVQRYREAAEPPSNRRWPARARRRPPMPNRRQPSATSAGP